MIVLILCIVIMYKIAEMSGMSGILWGAITFVVALGLGQVIPVVFWSAPLAFVIVYIPLLLVSLKKGPQ